VWLLKTLKISDGAHAKLTSIVGKLMAETGKMKTYSDAIETLLTKSVVLSPELLDEFVSYVRTNSQLGYATKEEFIQDAVRSRLICRPVELRSLDPTNLSDEKRKTL
jgi:hypothetical protein